MERSQPGGRGGGGGDTRLSVGPAFWCLGIVSRFLRVSARVWFVPLPRLLLLLLLSKGRSFIRVAIPTAHSSEILPGVDSFFFFIFFFESSSHGG